jgi:hypothetical protein
MLSRLIWNVAHAAFMATSLASVAIMLAYRTFRQSGLLRE